VRRGKPEPPARDPHPDGRVEVELLRVIGLLRSAARTEARLDDITARLRESDRDRYKFAGRQERRFDDLGRQADGLREERADLEAQLASLHEEAARRLADLGNDAAYLGAVRLE
jgi:predicted  nucleic acid-binding Zn-ribbon protein